MIPIPLIRFLVSQSYRSHDRNGSRGATRSSWGGLLFCVLLATGLGDASAARADGQIGEYFYRTGRLPDGQPVRAMLSDGVPVDARQLPCTSCHRPSGFGTTEGDETAPPVIWSALARPRTEDLRTPYRSRALAEQARDAYDEAAFARAVREGIDPSGRELDPAMPRYALDDEVIDSIITHLQSLSVSEVVGISNDEVHLATIIASDAPPTQKEDWLAVLAQFADDKNAETRNDSDRSKNGPFYKDTTQGAYRRWNLHVWELEGDPAHWRSQLDTLLAAQPVFAIAGGVVPGTWQPIGAFCEEQQIPCILPSTNLPDLSESQRYSFFFSRGLDLEAELLVAHLEERGVAPGTPIVQIYAPKTDGEEAARIAAVRLRAAGYSSLTSRIVGGAGHGGEAGSWSEIAESALLSGADEAIIRVAWLDRNALAEFLESEDSATRSETTDLYLSGTLLDSATRAAPDVATGAWLLHPFELPERLRRTTVRGRAWIQQRGLTKTPSRTHLDAYLAALTIQSGINHMRTNFSRAYFMERIEHAVDSAVYRSVYARLSLGPEQRFLSKTGHVVRLESVAVPVVK